MRIITYSFILISLVIQLKVLSEEPSFVSGDALPNAPELAKRGQYKVGVRTIQLLHHDQSPNYDRNLTVEIWYPAKLRSSEPEYTTYQDYLLSKKIFKLSGRAARNASVDVSLRESPLIILSHGFPGSRYILAYLAENLASKGYVVASIDHTDSTHAENYKNKFGSTLYNRSRDQNFVISEIEKLTNQKQSFLYQRVNVNNTAIVGYSMGGYGALNAAGAGFSKDFVELTSVTKLVPNHQLAALQQGNEHYRNALDSRIKAIVLLAPWGGEASLIAFGVPKGMAAFDKDGLLGIHIPSLFIVGSNDQVAFYEGGVKSLYEGAVNSDRYLLLFDHGQHHIATHPAPPEAIEAMDFKHYQEDVWDLRRLNNINQHFITAFLDKTLKDNVHAEYLESTSSENGHWKGFPKGSTIGIHFYHKNSGEQ